MEGVSVDCLFTAASSCYRTAWRISIFKLECKRIKLRIYNMSTATTTTVTTATVKKKSKNKSPPVQALQGCGSREMEVQINSFLTSTPYGVRCQLHGLARFTPRENILISQQMEDGVVPQSLLTLQKRRVSRHCQELNLDYAAAATTTTTTATTTTTSTNNNNNNNNNNNKSFSLKFFRNQESTSYFLSAYVISAFVPFGLSVCLQ